jgi:hypothetical protein
MKNIHKINQNIYITSDEEIKEGDWVLYFKYNSPLIHKVFNPDNFKKTGKKIILTTDQDLIKDGVQAIDYEFLEWFVKNPSCETIEVNSELNMDGKNGLDRARFIFKINVPKEEPKKVGEYQQELFSYLHDLGITALQSEMQEIERIVLGMQQEQDKNKYSEEEVMDLLNNLRLDTYSNSMGRVEFLEWFEQFKKK